MGLDMGIIVKRTPYTNSIEALQPYAYTWDKEKKFDFELCYWRKCFNIYHDLEWYVFCKNIDNDTYTPMDIDDLKKTIALLKSYNAKNWRYGGGIGSIWTWAQHKKSNARHIRNLRRLIRLMRKDPEIQPYLYISY